MHNDQVLAGSLFYGNLQSDDRGLYITKFLSRKTRPTEDDARKALCRILLAKEPPPRSLLVALAHAFHPDGCGEVKVILKKRGKGHSDPRRDDSIAFWVHRLRQRGRSYRDAIAAVADSIDKNEKHVGRIYGKHLKDLTRRYPLAASDRRSNAVT
jgi:hypothetical protein